MNENSLNELLTSIIDAFEKLFSSLTLVQGRRSTYTFIVCVIITAVSQVFHLLGFYTFISLPEGVTACLFSALMVLISKDNKRIISNIKLKFKEGVKDERQ